MNGLIKVRIYRPTGIPHTSTATGWFDVSTGSISVDLPVHTGFGTPVPGGNPGFAYTPFKATFDPDKQMTVELFFRKFCIDNVCTVLFRDKDIVGIGGLRYLPVDNGKIRLDTKQ